MKLDGIELTGIDLVMQATTYLPTHLTGGRKIIVPLGQQIEYQYDDFILEIEDNVHMQVVSMLIKNKVENGEFEKVEIDVTWKNADKFFPDEVFEYVDKKKKIEKLLRATVCNEIVEAEIEELHKKVSKPDRVYIIEDGIKKPKGLVILEKIYEGTGTKEITCQMTVLPYRRTTREGYKRNEEKAKELGVVLEENESFVSGHTKNIVYTTEMLEDLGLGEFDVIGENGSGLEYKEIIDREMESSGLSWG